MNQPYKTKPAHEDELFLDDIDELAQLHDELPTEDPPQIDSLEDLDALLSESLTLASAKKSKGIGKRLTDDEAAALARARVAEEEANWEVHGTFACFAVQQCSACNSTTRSLLGYYKHTTHRTRKDAAKLERVAPPQQLFLPIRRYYVQEAVASCHSCMSAWPVASGKDCGLLASLGKELIEPVQAVVTEAPTTLSFQGTMTGRWSNFAPNFEEIDKGYEHF